MSEELQVIVQKYFETQKNSNLKQCIYEEKSSGDDIEWFFDSENWCYFEEKETRDKFSEEYNKEMKTGETGKQYKTVHELVQKRHKTFNKNCTILDLSFKNYMLWHYHNFKNIDVIDDEDIELYISKYLKSKEENKNLTVNEFNYLLVQEEKIKGDKIKAQQQGCVNKGCGCLTSIFFLILIISMFSK